MKIKTINLYEFGELSEEAQQKALENLRDFNTDDTFWSEFILDDWKEKLEAMGFESPEIHYSGFCCQGDGASFTCKSVDLARLIKANKDGKRFAAILRNLKNGNLYIGAWIKSISSHYSHEYTVNSYSEWEWYGSDRYNPALVKNADSTLSKTLGEIDEYIISIARPLMKQIYRDLEKEYEYMTSDDAVKETILANEYTFTADGKLKS